MAKIKLSTAARRDLKLIWVYIAEDSVQAADGVVDQIASVLQLLAQSPSLGRSRDELAAGIRSFPVGNFVIFYLPRKGGISVVRVLDGHRDIPALFQ